MAEFNITAPDGKQFRVKAPEGATKEQALERIKAQYQGQQTQEPAQRPQDEQGGEQSYMAGVGERVTGDLDAAASIVSSGIGEALAGLSGIGAQIMPGGRTGGEQVERVREATTRQPSTPQGQRTLQSIGETTQPAAEAFSGAEQFLGDTVFEETGSPALAAAAKTIPTAVLEATGAGVGRAGLGGVRRLRERGVERSIAEAAPSIEDLKGTSRAVFKEIDDLGASVKPNAYRKLASDIRKEATNMGIDKDVTPKANRALDRIMSARGNDVSLSDLDTLRSVAQGAAKSIEPQEAAIGTRMINTIDDFLDDANANTLQLPKAVDADVGKRYRAARNLWGRARKSEMLQEAFEKARNQASGFENGLRVQFRSILNNKKRRKFFSEDERDAMRKVVQGDTKENLAKLIGRFGFSEGQATNFLGGTIGATAGGMVGGVPGAIAIPLVGQVSKGLAQRMTRGNAEFADQVIRAGRDAKQITKAYMKNTPRADRSPEELSQLLMRPDVYLGDLADVSDDIVSQAARQAANRRVEMAGAAAGGAAAPRQEEQQ